MLSVRAFLILTQVSACYILCFRNQMGIKYFLIIDIDKKLIEINTLTDKQYKLSTYSGSLPYQFRLEDDCTIDVELNNILE